MKNGMNLVKVGSLMIFGGYILAAIGTIKAIKEISISAEEEINDLKDCCEDTAVVENEDDYHF